MKETDISRIEKKERKIVMKHNSAFVYFNIAYVAGLICFLILFYFKIITIFFTIFIVVISIVLLFSKLIYWYSIRKLRLDMQDIDKQKFFLLRLTFCLFTYITPAYCIIQEPSLVISHYISTITFIIVIILAIIGIFIERWLFFFESQQTINENNAE